MKIAELRIWLICGLTVALTVGVTGFAVSRSVTTPNAMRAFSAVPQPEADPAPTSLADTAPAAADSATSQSTSTSDRPAGPSATESTPGVERAVDPATPISQTETVVLAGGCFWGVQGVFQHVEGVIRAESGYVGGSADTANYDAVSTGSTGHAESVAITFDPARVSLEQILQVFFMVAHDPTQLDRQGPDVGSQYRSAIFAQSTDQEFAITAYIDTLIQNRISPDPIATTVQLNTQFFPAEAHHQDFLNSNPNYPYIVIHDLPKVKDLKARFPELFQAEPVLILPSQ